MSPEQFESIRKLAESHGTHKIFPAGAILVQDYSHTFYIPIVVKGLIKVVQTDEQGSDVLLYFLRPGEGCIMSFMCSLTGTESKIKAIAEEDTEVIMVSSRDAAAWARQDPRWVEYFFALYQQRFEELLKVVNGLVSQNLEVRLYRHLLERIRITGTRELHLTHDKLAQELGSSRVVISRILKKLEKEGRLTLSRSSIKML